jgi:hypothetical protein
MYDGGAYLIECRQCLETESDQTEVVEADRALACRCRWSQCARGLIGAKKNWRTCCRRAAVLGYGGKRVTTRRGQRVRRRARGAGGGSIEAR